jgi:hypothetical protein
MNEAEHCDITKITAATPVAERTAILAGVIRQCRDCGQFVSVTFMEASHNGKKLPFPAERTLVLHKNNNLRKAIKGDPVAAKGAATCLARGIVTVDMSENGVPDWRRINAVTTKRVVCGGVTYEVPAMA